MITSKEIPFCKDEIILKKIKINEKGCWEWTGCTGRGYGLVHITGEKYLFRAHRVSWSIFKGRLTQGMVLDHLCKNKKCVNPDHLREVIQKINTYNDENTVSANRLKTHCKHGHEFTDDNTIKKKYNGKRACLECRRRRNREYKKRKFEKLKVDL